MEIQATSAMHRDAIDMLARQTHLSVETVAEVYARELVHFEHAPVTHFVPLIVSRRVLQQLRLNPPVH